MTFGGEAAPCRRDRARELLDAVGIARSLDAPAGRAQRRRGPAGGAGTRAGQRARADPRRRADRQPRRRHRDASCSTSSTASRPSAASRCSRSPTIPRSPAAPITSSSSATARSSPHDLVRRGDRRRPLPRAGAPDAPCSPCSRSRSPPRCSSALLIISTSARTRVLSQLSKGGPLSGIQVAAAAPEPDRARHRQSEARAPTRHRRRRAAPHPGAPPRAQRGPARVEPRPRAADPGHERGVPRHRRRLRPRPRRHPADHRRDRPAPQPAQPHRGRGHRGLPAAHRPRPARPRRARSGPRSRSARRGCSRAGAATSTSAADGCGPQIVGVVAQQVLSAQFVASREFVGDARAWTAASVDDGEFTFPTSRYAGLFVVADGLDRVGDVRAGITRLGYSTSAPENLIETVRRYLRVVEIVLAGIGLIALDDRRARHHQRAPRRDPRTPPRDRRAEGDRRARPRHPPPLPHRGRPHRARRRASSAPSIGYLIARILGVGRQLLPARPGAARRRHRPAVAGARRRGPRRRAPRRSSPARSRRNEPRGCPPARRWATHEPRAASPPRRARGRCSRRRARGVLGRCAGDDPAGAPRSPLGVRRARQRRDGRQRRAEQDPRRLAATRLPRARSRAAPCSRTSASPTSAWPRRCDTQLVPALALRPTVATVDLTEDTFLTRDVAGFEADLTTLVTRLQRGGRTLVVLGNVLPGDREPGVLACLPTRRAGSGSVPDRPDRRPRGARPRTTTRSTPRSPASPQKTGAPLADLHAAFLAARAPWRGGRAVGRQHVLAERVGARRRSRRCSSARSAPHRSRRRSPSRTSGTRSASGKRRRQVGERQDVGRVAEHVGVVAVLEERERRAGGRIGPRHLEERAARGRTSRASSPCRTSRTGTGAARRRPRARARATGSPARPSADRRTCTGRASSRRGAPRRPRARRDCAAAPGRSPPSSPRSSGRRRRGSRRRARRGRWRPRAASTVVARSGPRRRGHRRRRRSWASTGRPSSAGQPERRGDALLDRVAEVEPGHPLDQVDEDPVRRRRVVLEPAFPAPTPAATGRTRRAGRPDRRPRRASGAFGKPAVWSSTWSRVMTSLPFVANSGTRSATRCSGASSPSPMSNHTIDATIGLVAENAQNCESFVAAPNVSNASSSPSRATASWHAGVDAVVHEALRTPEQLVEAHAAAFVPATVRRRRRRSRRRAARSRRPAVRAAPRTGASSRPGPATWKNASANAARALALEEEVHHHVPASRCEQVPRALEDGLPVGDHREAEHRDHRVDPGDPEEVGPHDPGVGLDQRDVLPAGPLDLGAGLPQHPGRASTPEDPPGAGDAAVRNGKLAPVPHGRSSTVWPGLQPEEVHRVDAVLAVQRLGGEVVEPREHVVVPEPRHGRGRYRRGIGRRGRRHAGVSRRRDPGPCAVMPPSTRSVSPVTNAASSEAR